MENQLEPETLIMVFRLSETRERIGTHMDLTQQKSASSPLSRAQELNYPLSILIQNAQEIITFFAPVTRLLNKHVSVNIPTMPTNDATPSKHGYSLGV